LTERESFLKALYLLKRCSYFEKSSNAWKLRVPKDPDYLEKEREYDNKTIIVSMEAEQRRSPICRTEVSLTKVCFTEVCRMVSYAGTLRNGRCYFWLRRREQQYSRNETAAASADRP
jgi:hypothetical protein